jgi:hypothetical protein
VSWFDATGATRELPRVGLNLDGVTWHAALNRLDDIDTAAHQQCADNIGRLLAKFAPDHINLTKPRPGDTVDACLARLQAVAALVNEWAGDHTSIRDGGA